MKRIVHTIYSGLGGHGNVLFSLLDSEFSEKFENHVVFYGIEKALDDYQNNARQWCNSSIEIIKKPKRYVKGFKRFKNYLKEVQPDVVFIHSSELLIPALKLRKSLQYKVVYVEHEPNHTKTKLEWYLSKRAINKADKVVCLNNIYKNELISKYHPNPDIISIIPNGIDTGRFTPKDCLNKEAFKIGMAARLVDTKDHELLIRSIQEIVRQNREIHLEIAGSGELENDLKRLVGEFNLTKQIKFLGRLNESALIEFYQSLDLYVHATKSETLSTSILQAMGCGKGVLTSDINNNQALIEDGKTGYLYKNGSSDSLVSVILNLMDEQDKIDKIAKAGRNLVLESYSKEQMVKLYSTEIEALN